MDVRLRITGPPALPPLPDLPPIPESLLAPPQKLPARPRPRPLGFCCSLVLHAAVFAYLLSPSSQSPELHNVYTSLIAPVEKDHKLIWYQFKEKLPEVSPLNPTAEQETRVRTLQRAKQQIVTAPQADPGKQLVWIPAPQIKLKEDLKAPNLIALQPPVVPAPPKPQAKPFVAPEPPQTSRPALPNPLPTAPALASNATPNPGVDALLNKTPARPRRAFTPPTNPTAPTPSTAITLPTAPTLEGARGTAGGDSLLNTPMARPRRDFTPPAAPGNPQPGAGPAALPSAPSIEAAHGPAGVSVAILGLNPSNAPQLQAPEGARAARIAVGPDAGADQPQLGKGNSPLAIPDVSIQGKPGPSTPTATGPRPSSSSTKPGLGTAPMPATQTVSLQSTAHVSVAQYPSSRFLPPFIERRFHTRVVYNTVLPAAQNGEDWVVWFAEEGPTPTDTRLLMRPPTLLHGLPLPPVPTKEDHGTGKLLIVGVLGKDGHFGSFSEETDAAGRELLDTLQLWQFNPAMRNGVPVDVETVLEIPLVYTAKAVISNQ